MGSLDNEDAAGADDLTMTHPTTKMPVKAEDADDGQADNATETP